MLGQLFCKDCAPAQVHHGPLRLSIYLGVIVKPIFRPIDLLFQALLPARMTSLFDRLAPLALKTLAVFRGIRASTEPSDFDSDRTKCLWEEAKHRGISLTEYRLTKDVKDLFIARFEGKTRCFEGLPRPLGPEAKSLYWMDNKPAMRKHFAEAGIPLAGGIVCFSESQAREAFQKLSKPLITKPHTGSRSRHTTVHLETEEEFLKAFRKAKELTPWVLVEEELSGMVFRGTLFGGKLTAVMAQGP